MAPSPDLADLKQQHRDEIREAEFEWVTSVLPSGSVLELGAGDGKRSRQLRESGRTVLSLEVSGGPYREQAAPGLVFYDGVHVPAPSDTFDIIFSSHVLEHVEDLPELLSECRRVLAPDGVAIHVLPTATWRALTIGTRYLGILAAIRRRLTRRDSASGVAGSGSEASQRRDPSPPSISRLLVPRAHGTRGNAFTEIWHFSRVAWQRRIEEAGWEVVQIIPGQLAFSGNHVLRSRLSLEQRGRLASVTGASSRLLICRPAER